MALHLKTVETEEEGLGETRCGLRLPMVLASGTTSPLCQAFACCSFFLEQLSPALHLVSSDSLPVIPFRKPSLILPTWISIAIP